jgi:FkbM family methyltransferase
VSVPHNPIQKKVGRFVTRFMMRRPIRATAVGRRAYARMYLVGKRLAERREQDLLRRHLRPGMTVFDLGANVGFYTEQFSRLIGSSGKVYAFEPDPFCSEILRDRVRRLENVQVESVALGERRGEVTLYCSNRDRAENRTHPFDPGVPAEAVRVPVRTLDGFCRSRHVTRVDAVKMDVEGDEVHVLRGMSETMARTPPAWMFIEFCPAQLRGAGSSPEEFWDLLEERGYRSYSIESGGELRAIPDSRAFTESQARSFTNILAVYEPAATRVAPRRAP